MYKVSYGALSIISCMYINMAWTAQRTKYGVNNSPISRTLNDTQQEEAREKEINQTLLTNCIQMLSHLGSIALAPHNPPAIATFFIQAAQLVLNVAHAIFKESEPAKRRYKTEIMRTAEILRICKQLKQVKRERL